MIVSPSNEDSNQPVHLTVWSESSSLSVWRNFISLAIQNVPSEDSDQTAYDQTGRICKLTWIFALRTCLKVRFLMLRLICYFYSLEVPCGGVLMSTQNFKCPIIWYTKAFDKMSCKQCLPGSDCCLIRIYTVCHSTYYFI